MFRWAVVAAATVWVTVVTGQPDARYYKTKDEAVKDVPQHVSPPSCFVWKDGPPATPWRVIPGTGCAHWVAHQKGIGNGAQCNAGCSIRVRDVVAGKKSSPLSEARVGDIWATANLSHCGIVRGLHKDATGKIDSVNVENCSSARGGVVTTTYSAGSVYR